MVVSNSQKEASRRYYLKNREGRLVEMRKNERERRAAIQSVDDKEAARGYNRDKYYKGIENRQKAQIKELLEDVGICPAFKAFLRTNVLPIIGVGALPIKFIGLCKSTLAIKCAIPTE